MDTRVWGSSLWNLGDLYRLTGARNCEFAYHSNKWFRMNRYEWSLESGFEAYSRVKELHAGTSCEKVHVLALTIYIYYQLVAC